MKHPSHMHRIVRSGMYAHMRALLLAPLLAAMIAASAAAGTITVLSPNGGETYADGQTVQVRWSSAGVSGEVEVSFSVGGSSWRRIDRVDVSAGSVSWTIDRSGPNALVRVASRKGSESDQSDGTFTITPDPLDLTLMKAPNGGEVWTEGEKRTIQWQVPADATGSVVELSTNGGLAWDTVGSFPSGISQLAWTIPHLGNDDITTALMRVSAADAPDHADLSDAPFTLKMRRATPVDTNTSPTVTILSPNGGEKLVAGSAAEVRWRTTNVPGTVTVELSTDGGGEWSRVGGADAAAGRIPWKVPATPTTVAILRATAAGGTAVDLSDRAFSIVEAPDSLPPLPPGAIRLLTPNGGEFWGEGEQRMITWEHNGRTGTLSVEVSIDNGRFWLPVTTAPTADGQVLWIVPRVTDAEASGILRIVDADDPRVADTSDAPFIIHPFSPVAGLQTNTGTAARSASSVTIAPNPAGTSTEIRWRQELPAEATLRLFDGTGRLVRELDAGLRPSGMQTLTIMVDDLPTGSYIYELRAARSVNSGRMVITR